MRAVRQVCDKHGVPLIFDACRFAENCFFIQQREPGYSNHSVEAIAKELWVAEQTVKFHLSNIYRKLDVANRTEASRWAQLSGLLPAAGTAPAAEAAVA